MIQIPRVPALNENCRQAVRERFDRLIKPVGSLARLEEITCLYAAAQGLRELTVPNGDLLLVVSNCGGLAADGTFDREGDPLHILAASLGVGVIPIFLAAAPVKTGAASGLAVTEEEIAAAFRQGREAARSAAANGSRVVGLDCRGGSPVSRAALSCWLLAEQPQGLRPEERALLDEILDRHAGLAKYDYIGLLQAAGGLAQAALLGAIFQAAGQGLPVFLDGVDTLLAAFAAVNLRPEIGGYLVAVSTTEEAAQNILLTRLGLSTMLDLKLRSPCGEGALFGFSLLAAGIKALNEMDSFGRVHSPLGNL